MKKIENELFKGDEAFSIYMSPARTFEWIKTKLTKKPTTTTTTVNAVNVKTIERSFNHTILLNAFKPLCFSLITQYGSW